MRLCNSDPAPCMEAKYQVWPSADLMGVYAVEHTTVIEKYVSYTKSNTAGG